MARAAWSRRCPRDKDNLYLDRLGAPEQPDGADRRACAELSHVEKIKRSGADAVVSPNFIGGMRLVSELLRPGVVRFLDDMLRDRRAAFRIEEVTLGDDATALGATLRDARIRERFGMTVLATCRDAMPPGTTTPTPRAIGPGMTLVVLGSAEQVAELRKQSS